MHYIYVKIKDTFGVDVGTMLKSARQDQPGPSWRLAQGLEADLYALDIRNMMDAFKHI